MQTMSKNLTIKYVKHPILNIFLGDLGLDVRELSKLFTFKSCDTNAVQTLHISLSEGLENTVYENNTNEHSIILHCKDNISESFKNIAPELINQICICAKQRKYEEKGRLSINLVLSASDSLYYFSNVLLEVLESSLKKAFINGIDISLFNIYEENFDLNLKKSKENLAFINKIYEIVSAHSSIVSGVYFLSNYDNNEIYTKEFAEKIFEQIAAYVEVKILNDRIVKDEFLPFSESKFLNMSNYFAEEFKTSKAQNCCTIGVTTLSKPSEYIKKIMELSMYEHQSKLINYNTSTVLQKLNLNPFLLISQTKGLVSFLAKSVERINNQNYVEGEVKNRLDRISIKYDLYAIKKEIKNNSHQVLKNFYTEKLSQMHKSLVAFLSDEHINLFSFCSLISNIIAELYKERDNFSTKSKNCEQELKTWQERKVVNLLPKYVLKKYFHSKIANPVDFFLVNKWKRLYLRKIQNVLLSNLYDLLIEHFKQMHSTAFESLSLFNNKYIQTKHQISSISSKLDVLQLENTIEYYYEFACNLLNNDYFLMPEIDYSSILSVERLVFDDIAEKMIDNAIVTANKIYEDYISEYDYFKEFCSRLNIDRKESYIKFFEELLQNDPVSLRVIDNEKIYKEICLCVPYNFELDNDFIEAIRKNKAFENIKLIRHYDFNEFKVIYINGNIDMSEVFHF